MVEGGCKERGQNGDGSRRVERFKAEEEQAVLIEELRAEDSRNGQNPAINSSAVQMSVRAKRKTEEEVQKA